MADLSIFRTSEEDTVMQDNGNGVAHFSNGFVNPESRADDEPNGSVHDDSEDDDESVSDLDNPIEHPDISLRKYAFLPTGLCYDDRMKLHANADFTGQAGHPEDPGRISAIYASFRANNLVFDGDDTELLTALADSPTKWMWRIQARRATMSEICLVHTASHYAWVSGLDAMEPSRLREMTSHFDNGRKSLYVGNLTNEAALLSAGGAIETCKNVVAGKVKNAIAVIRPPGHHAEHNESMGFCLFNNVPIAAKVCQAEYPESCRKVLILDWDVHHGNGIQNMFYDDPNILYISLHVYQNGEFYPGRPEDGSDLPDGGIENVGRRLGMGKNINIGWHDKGMGDGEYMAAFQKIVMPVAQEFNPDLVIVAAGFDAANGDELGGCYVTPACYSQMTHMLMSLANGKIAVCLEGGYNLMAISRSALAVAKTLMGEPPMRIKVPPLNHMSARVLHQVKHCHAP
jgi:histone deacetylase 6